MNGFQHITSVFFWLLFCVFTFVAAVGISWQLNSHVNFSYPLWYDTLEIDQHIHTYAKQNSYNKQHFVFTNKEQHVSLFAEVVTAINNHGRGLSTISFQVNEQSTRLFRAPEVAHLRDVAHLVEKLFIASIISVSGLLTLSVFYITGKLKAPNAKLKLCLLLAIVVSVTATLLGFGFKQVFSFLHEITFTSGNPWFFYYQDSLMSTFMKAPDLFAAMAINLFAVAVVVFSFIYGCVYYGGRAYKQRLLTKSPTGT